MVRNYYAILGVSLNASQEEIRAAYRRLVKSVHPDVSGKETSERFREIQEAWETLGDPVRRRQYDLKQRRVRRPSFPQPEPVAPSQARGVSESLTWHDWFESFFVHSFPATKASVERELHFDLQLTPHEAAAGGELPVRLPFRIRCSACGGSGRSFLFLCAACRGRGFQPYVQTVVLEIPPRLRPGTTLEVRLDEFGYPPVRLVLHVHVYQ